MRTWQCSCNFIANAASHSIRRGLEQFSNVTNQGRSLRKVFQVHQLSEAISWHFADLVTALPNEAIDKVCYECQSRVHTCRFPDARGCWNLLNSPQQMIYDPGHNHLSTTLTFAEADYRSILHVTNDRLGAVVCLFDYLCFETSVIYLYHSHLCRAIDGGVFVSLNRNIRLCNVESVKCQMKSVYLKIASFFQKIDWSCRCNGADRQSNLSHQAFPKWLSSRDADIGDKYIVV